jgi:hypothetical protein
MSENFSSSQPIGPISVGDVVSAGVRIYRDHFKSYFGVAIRATLWGLLPFLALIPIPLLLINGEQNLAALLLLVPLGLLLFLYGTAKYTANSALISRLAFRELVNKPESTKDARRELDPKFWIFFRTYLLISLLSIGVVIGFYLGVLILGIIGGYIGYSIRANTFIIVLLVVVGLLAFGVALSALIRFFTRLAIFEVPLAIEENIKATQTIGRSWRLTKGHVGRIFLILTVAFLISLPIYIITQFIVNIILATLLGVLSIDSTAVAFQLISFLVAYSLGLVSQVVILPFWQAIKAVIYYDLCTRKEGMGLQIRDSYSQ